MIQFDIENDHSLFDETFRFAQRQVKALIERDPDFSPMYTKGGKWKHNGPVWTRWCDGFLPGMMWLFHKRSEPGSEDAKFWLDHAIRYTTPLEPRKLDPESHDLGFLFMSTIYRWAQVKKDPALHDVLVQGGRTLAGRFQEKGGYVRSFVAEDSLFIDVMMNVGLIFYAARESGDKKLREIALRHCHTTRRTLVRGDGSVAQEGIFDVATGEFLRQTTHQGYRGDSCWSRGLAWALYGFGACYEFARDPRFLETAEACADYYITHTPNNGVPPWDYNAPAESRKMVDTSAAAIAASGFLRLSRILADPVKGHLYWCTGIKILRTLCENYSAALDPGWEGTLKGGLYHLHKNLGVGESMMWGEYFFVEALEHALRQ